MRYTVYLFALLFFAACGKKTNPLTVELTNGSGKLVYLEKFENNFPVTVDSAIIPEDGKVVLHFPNTIDLYRLRINPNDGALLILDSSNTPSVKADANQILATYTISGSKNSELVFEFYKKTNAYNFHREQLRNRLALIPLEDSVRRDSVLAEVEKAKEDFANYRHSFIDSNPNSPALITTLNQFDLIAELDYLKKIEAAVAISMPKSEYHKMVSSTRSQAETQIQFLEMQRQQEEATANLLKAGTPAPEIALTNPDNILIKLSSLKGKIVLVDFWASWCGPCRKENPTVVKLYEKYKNKGFEVYSVSLDKDKAKWIQAIKEDGLSWPSHVSDLMMWNSSVVPQYGITAIPFTVLLDKKGNVIETNLRGEELSAKLQELLGA